MEAHDALSALKAISHLHLTRGAGLLDLADNFVIALEGLHAHDCEESLLTRFGQELGATTPKTG